MKLKFNYREFNRLKREAPKSMVDEITADIAERAGKGFGWKASDQKYRYQGIVFTDTYRARIVNARDNTLLKALRG